MAKRNCPLVKNALGECMGVYAVSIAGITHPPTIEAIAASRALEFASQMGFNEIELEGDAQSVIKKKLQFNDKLFLIDQAVLSVCSLKVLMCISYNTTHQQ